MTPTRLRECITILGWTQRGLARMLERQEGTIRMWARGASSIPADVAEWLEQRTQQAQSVPAPRRVK